MSYIFISYSNQDKDYANALAAFLQAQGFDIWIDQIGIEYGDDWWDAIVEGLRGCGAFIVVMTPESKASKWVKREVLLAIQWDKLMMPLLLKGKIWDILAGIHIAPVQNGEMPDADFIRRLRGHIPAHPQRGGENRSDFVPEKFDMNAALADFVRAYQEQRWSDAVRIWAWIEASGLNHSPFDFADFEPAIQAGLDEEKRQREEAERIAERGEQYQRVLLMTKFTDKAAVYAAFLRFRERFPDYDPEAIERRFFPLPDPFEWIDIPAGRVELADGHGWFDVPAFQISKYPITNAQFALFIEDGGYENRDFWTEAGWQVRSEGWEWDWSKLERTSTGKPWVAPRYWQDEKWNGHDYPVVGISWYEALAYCRWLSARTGSNQILLPTEQQWQRAAQGDDGRVYPWGNEWDVDRCNCRESGIRHTTPVTRYPQGASPFGVMDMSGNVWEWTLGEYDNPVTRDINNNNVRVLRGGSWHHLHYLHLPRRQSLQVRS